MIDLFTWRAPNGQRVSVMLEECGLPYRVRPVDLTGGEHLRPEFLSVNPNGAVPVIVDHDADGGALQLAQSAAILLYLARRSGRLLPSETRAEARVLEAFMFVMTDLAAAAVSTFLVGRLDPSPAAALDVFRARLRKFLDEAERRLGHATHLAGDYSVADVALYPLTRLPVVQSVLDEHGGFERLRAWREQLAGRPAVEAGMAWPPGAEPTPV